MKRFFLSLCCVAFLSIGLSSCADEAAEITPDMEITSPQFDSDEEPSKVKAEKPGS